MLTRRQARFVEEFLLDSNATQAALRAGYSARTARQIASKLLSKVDIQKCIAATYATRREQIEVSAETVVAELAKIGFNSPSAVARVRGLELLGKYLGLFRHRVEHEHTHEHTHTFRWDLSILNREELQALEPLIAKLENGPCACDACRAARTGNGAAHPALPAFITEEIQ